MSVCVCVCLCALVGSRSPFDKEGPYFSFFLFFIQKAVFLAFSDFSRERFLPVSVLIFLFMFVPLGFNWVELAFDFSKSVAKSRRG